jgi:hypothetical protein
MHALQSLVAAAALWASVSMADPDPLFRALRGKRTFSFMQSPVKRNSQWRGPMSMRRAYLKYGLAPPDTIGAAARMAELQPPPGQTSVGVRPVKGDVEYLITVGVGNHNLSLDLDTGSSDLYVFLSFFLFRFDTRTTHTHTHTLSLSLSLSLSPHCLAKENKKKDLTKSQQLLDGSSPPFSPQTSGAAVQ